MDDFHLFTSIRYDPALLQIPELGFAGTGWNQHPSPFYMLDLHRDRMLRAATYWDWPAAVAAVAGEQGLDALHTFLRAITRDVGNSPQRIKITLAADGSLGHQISPLAETRVGNLFPEYLPAPDPEDSARPAEARAPVRHPVYEIVVDSRETARSEFTHYKTTSRGMYDDARKRARIALGDKREVLLVNHDGHIMEGSISTPYFWRDGKWVTPPVPKQFLASRGSGGNDGTTRRWALERNLVAEQVVAADSLVDGEECWISNGLLGFALGKPGKT
ncbi:aminotransferase [Durotheca rogersii]|uniref:aminotransferase n=1 Tax=Durotheca rogersii TaxID=419775 RepID=UPI00221F41FA|nr:aminotransferase [Durotheca rogersii]KAI5860201.1 aminotransferase [Durotheca rogersii]